MNDIPAQRQPPRAYFVSTVLAAIIGMLSVAVILFAWPPRITMDAVGATSLVYEIKDKDAHENPQDVDPLIMDALVNALSRRVDPTRTRQAIVRPHGDRQVEIVTPALDIVEVTEIKRRISALGVLQFRIVANQVDHADVIALAQNLAADQTEQRSTVVRDASGVAVGRWVHVAREPTDVNRWRILPSGFVIRDALTGEIFELPSNILTGSGDEIDSMRQFNDFLASRGTEQFEVLIATNDGYDVTGRHVGYVGRAYDERMSPCINVSLVGEGISLFADLTQDYSPSGRFIRQLGVVLDDELLTAPNIHGMISRSARITGQFSNEEVDFIVDILRAGSLPVALQDDPVSESLIAPDPAVKRTMLVAGGSGAAVLLIAWLFLLIRFGAVGIAAACAGLAQVLMTVAMMLIFQTTLSGLLISQLAFVAVLVTAGNAGLCEVRRRQVFAIRSDGKWTFFQLAILLVPLLYGALLAVAGALYLLGGTVRNQVGVLLAGSVAALVIHATLWVVAETLSYLTATTLPVAGGDNSESQGSGVRPEN